MHFQSPRIDWPKRARLAFARLCIAVAALLAASAAAEPITFAVIGDYGKGAHARRVDDLIATWTPNFIITLGDNSYSADQTSNHQPQNSFAVDVLPAFRTYIDEGRFFPSLGNHDYHAPGSDHVPARVQRYLDTLRPPLGGPGEGRYYEFARGPVRFFALNSNSYEPNKRVFYKVQGDWLRERLAAATERFKVVYFHHPPYTTSTRGPVRDLRWPFKEWGVSLVLSGHEHSYERFERRGLMYVVNGLGGNHHSTHPLSATAQIPGVTKHVAYPTSTADRKFGAMRVEANDDGMELTMFTVRIVGQNVEGVQRDHFTIAANAVMPAPIYRDLGIHLLQEKAADVAAWQDFLFERNLLGTDIDDAVDGHFGNGTRAATVRFQQDQNLTETGIADTATREHARGLGFKPVEDPRPN